MSSKYLSKSALATIKARQVEKKASKMAYKASSRTASKTASKSQERKMESTAVAIASAWFPGYNSKVCEHCGTKGSSTEIFCDCEAMVARFGEVGCKCCGIYYGTMDSVQEYITAWGEHETYYRYQNDMQYWMPTPCVACAPPYKLEHGAKLEAIKAWELDNMWRLDNYYDDYYGDEPCRSGRGGICPCCGD